MKQSKEIMQIQVGAFVVIGLALLMLVIFMLGSENRVFQKDYLLVSKFDTVKGLRAGAPIQLAGVNVGSIEEILFADDLKDAKVKVVFKIGEEYKRRIREDSVASIVTQGLLGDKMVVITVGSPETKILENGDLIESKAPASITEVMEQSGDLLDNVNSLAVNINDIVKTIREGKGLINQLVYDNDGEEIMEDVKGLAGHLKDASWHVSSVTGKVDQGQGTLGALVNDASLFNDMKTLLGKANRNKLVRAVIRHTLKTKEENGLKKD